VDGHKSNQKKNTFGFLCVLCAFVVKCLPLGDTAVLAYLSDEAAAWRFAAAARAADLPGRLDVVQAYASVAVFFDPGVTSLTAVTANLERLDTAAAPPVDPRRHELPCCYELNLDLARVAGHTGLTADDVIRLHTGNEYTVYAIGFCPGFPYLGYLPAELCGVPRLQAPRIRVEPGSVGLTGRQTGVYPLERPGGWNIIGRTPLVLADPADGYFPLRVGDMVSFCRIDEAAFRGLAGERLPLTVSQE
jgi:inhibitor of KinA